MHQLQVRYQDMVLTKGEAQAELDYRISLQIHLQPLNEKMREQRCQEQSLPA